MYPNRLAMTPVRKYQDAKGEGDTHSEKTVVVPGPPFLPRQAPPRRPQRREAGRGWWTRPSQPRMPLLLVSCCRHNKDTRCVEGTPSA